MTVVGAPVIQVPQGLGKREMEAYRVRIEQSMATATDIAQDWVDGRIAKPLWPAAAAAA
jgi:hypothetical protein